LKILPVLYWNGHRRNVTFLNRFGQEFFGYSEEEIIGRNVVGTIVPQIDSSGEDVGSKMAALVKNPELYENNENENTKSTGERAWIAWTIKEYMIRMAYSGKFTPSVLTGTTQVKAAATQQEKAKEEAAAAERTRLAGIYMMQ